MKKDKFAISAALLVLVIASLSFAQWGGRGRWRNRDVDDRAGVPMWENEPHVADDVFTFARVEYDSYGGGRWGRRRGGWATDYPDSDLNFSYRLQQLTSLKVNPNPVIVRLDDEKLFDYPFIYMIEPGALLFSDEEVATLRRYLLNGGFLMVDDFWGDYQYQNFYEQIKRVFPDREPQELPLEHEIIRCVYKLKERPQIPSIGTAMYGRGRGITWEPNHGGDCKTVHYQGIFDDKGRMMVVICHNTDLGDGWEEEGVDEWYFREFAEKKSYPMGINIVTYAMTH
jgi:hypothetical protein